MQWRAKPAMSWRSAERRPQCGQAALIDLGCIRCRVRAPLLLTLALFLLPALADLTSNADRPFGHIAPDAFYLLHRRDELG